MKAASIYKTHNGIYHKKSFYHSSCLSIVGSMAFIFLVIIVVVYKFAQIGNLVGVNVYSMSLNLIRE